MLYTYGNDTSFIITIYLITLLSFYEWTNMQPSPKYNFLLFLAIILTFNFFNIVNMYIVSLLSLFIWIILLTYMLINSNNLKNLIRKYHTLLGYIIFTLFFLHLINLFPLKSPLASENNIIDSRFYLFMLICFISVIDTFAYIFGKSVGNCKIVTNISPNKTLEGYVGSYIATIVFFILFFNFNHMIWTFNDLIFLSIFIISAFLGDLFISLIKRAYKKKDTGNILPGHGGLLDRLDSYLPSLPIFYIWFMI